MNLKNPSKFQRNTNSGILKSVEFDDDNRHINLFAQEVQNE